MFHNKDMYNTVFWAIFRGGVNEKNISNELLLESLSLVHSTKNNRQYHSLYIVFCSLLAHLLLIY
jgi:hypothetical protein